MIKFKSTLNGRVMLCFCLEEMNIVKLKEGKPILIYGEDFAIPFDITMMYGKDKETIIADLRKMGVELPPENTWKHAGGPPKSTH